jgi:hypothetical protein
VSLLDGGLAGWVAGGGELFRDVNAPSKAFGELVAGGGGPPPPAPPALGEFIAALIVASIILYLEVRVIIDLVRR